MDDTYYICEHEPLPLLGDAFALRAEADSNECTCMYVCVYNRGCW